MMCKNRELLANSEAQQGMKENILIAGSNMFQNPGEIG